MIACRQISLIALLIASAIGCAKKSLLDELPSASAKTLYVSSGLCYSGNGITTFTATTASNLIYTVNMNTGAPGEIIADYNQAAATAGSSPVSLHSKDNKSIYAVVENTTAGARRIESITRGNSTPAYYYSNATAFSGILRKSAFDTTSGTFLVNKSTALERINSTPTRDLAGANPWVSNPAGNCATTNTLITDVEVLPNGKILYGHASATAANRKLVLVASTGYRTAADCLNTAAVTVPSYITDIEYLPGSGQVLVLMADVTTNNNMNSVYVYDIDPVANTITNGQSLLENNSAAGSKNAPYLYGASAMEFDASSNTLYIAMANAIGATVANYNIEKFTYDPVAKTLTRVGSSPWSQGWVGSKCISSMLVK